MVAVAVAAVAMNIVACTKSTPKASPSKSSGVTSTATQSPAVVLDPCGLLTPQGLGTILGGKVGTPTPGNLLGSPECFFSVSGSSLGVSFTVQVVVFPHAGTGAFTAIQQNGAPHEAVTGVGDEALFAPQQGGVFFTKGDIMVFIVPIQPQGSPVPNPDQFKAAMIAAAKAAAGAL